MNVNKKLHDAKLLEWAALFKEQSESGLKVLEWCSSKGISKDTYYYWKHQLKDAYVEASMPEIVPLSLPSTPSPTNSESLLPTPNPSLNSRDLYNSCHSADTISVFMGDIRIEIGSNAPDDLISKVIGVMRHA